MDTMKDRNVMLRDDRNLMATISLNDELQFNDHSSLSLLRYVLTAESCLN